MDYAIELQGYRVAMDDPFGDQFDCVISPDRTRVAAWTLAVRDVTPDEECCLYEVAVSDARTGAPIAHITRRWRKDLHTKQESGSAIANVRFGSSGMLLVLEYADGSREAFPLPALESTPAAPELELVEEDFAELTLAGNDDPCSICGGASWSTAVCAECATYCEKLLVSGGLLPKPKR